MDEALSHRTTTEWISVFGGQIPAAPVLDIGQALNNPFVAEQGNIAEFAGHGDASGRPLRMLKGPFRLSDAELPTRPAPEMGEASASILSELGYSADRLKHLKEIGVL